MSSTRRRQQIEQLELENAKEIAGAISDILSRAKELNGTVARAPEAFLRGRLDREWVENESFRNAWQRKQDEGEAGALTDMVSHIAKGLEKDIDCLHTDETSDDSSFDDNTRALLTHVRTKAGLPDNFPLRLAADFLETEINNDPNSSSIPDRAANPMELQLMLNRAGANLRSAANDLVRATKPSTELPDGLTPADVANMSDREFERFKNHMGHMAELGYKKGRK